MANAQNFRLAGNDEHGMNPPTAGKRTPIMPYIGRSFYENEFNYPCKNYFLAHAARLNFATFDVKPERQDISINTRVVRTNNSGSNLVVTFAFNATADPNFNAYGGLIVFYSSLNQQASASRNLTQNIYTFTATNGYITGRGIDNLSGVGMLQSVRIPASLVEAGFMTNFNEAKLMVDPDYQQLIGSLTLEGVCSFLSVPYKSVQSTVFPLIRNGSRGTVVSYMQYRLKNYGYTISADGVFGSGTESVVRDFQSFNGLVSDGIVGAATWAKINNLYPTSFVLKRGAKGVEVRYMQQKLLSKLYPLTIDGIFGGGSEGEVKNFQVENALVADGIVGPATWAKLATIGGGRPKP